MSKEKAKIADPMYLSAMEYYAAGLREGARRERRALRKYVTSVVKKHPANESTIYIDAKISGWLASRKRKGGVR